jgi:hypothetical protein
MLWDPLARVAGSVIGMPTNVREVRRYAATTRRTRAPSRTLVGIALLFASVLVLVAPSALAQPTPVTAGPLVHLAPPYGGSSVTMVAGAPSSCHQHGYAKLPSFNNASGALVFFEKASIGPSSACRGSAANLGLTEYTQLTYTSPVFVGPANGLDLFRASWHFRWNVTLSESNGSDAYASFTVAMSVDDRTTGDVWNEPNGYSNSTVLSGPGASLSHSYAANLSLPVILALTAGDHYVFSFAFVSEVIANGGGSTGASAFAEISSGIHQNPTRLVQCTIY